jgi:hypothetical protein
MQFDGGMLPILAMESVDRLPVAETRQLLIPPCGTPPHNCRDSAPPIGGRLGELYFNSASLRSQPPSFQRPLPLRWLGDCPLRSA